jgi:hypothetical protein
LQENNGRPYVDTNPLAMLELKDQSTDLLIDLLTEYLERYKRTVQYAADEIEYSACRLAINAILEELNERRAMQSTGLKERADFEFNRIKTGAE